MRILLEDEVAQGQPGHAFQEEEQESGYPYGL